jgi:type 1 glutamine amidotransferase
MGFGDALDSIMIAAGTGGRLMRNSSSMVGMLLLFALWPVARPVILGAPAPPPAPARSAIEAALKDASPPDPSATSPPLRVLLLADKKDHGEGEHDYPRWQSCWTSWLTGKTSPGADQFNLYGPAIPDTDTPPRQRNLEVLPAFGFPTEAQFAAADVVVAFCYIPWNQSNREQLRAYLERGGGLVLIHSATWTMPKADPAVAALVGVGGFIYPRHGPVQLEITAPEHPICIGLPRRLDFVDESYWPPTPAIDSNRVTVLAVSQEKDNPTGSPAPQPMLWTAPTGRGRVFGCVLGHYSWTFDDPWFRLLVLRGIAWSANRPVHSWDDLALRGARVAER